MLMTSKNFCKHQRCHNLSSLCFVQSGQWACLPVSCYEALISNLLHIQWQRQRHDVPRQSIHDCTCLHSM